MTLAYSPPQVKASEIDPMKLRYPYFVQLASDGQHLVPGMLQQGTQPAIGDWLNVGSIEQDFPERYFAQYTNFNTLVPGSLVQAGRLPAGRWKEVKKKRIPFHRFVGDPYFLDPLPSHDTYSDPFEFNSSKVLPALDYVYPDRDPDVPIKMYIYIFKGSFEDLGNDPSKLIPFPSTVDFILPDGAFLGYLSYLLGGYTNILYTNDVAGELTFEPELPVGVYSIIAAILDEDDEVTDYFVFDGVLNRYAAP
jgi:hypothetical protein